MPGSMNQKNMALSPAAADLGLGDQLRSQVEAQVLEQQKRKKQQGLSGASDNPLIQSAAASMLLSPTFGGSNG